MAIEIDCISSFYGDECFFVGWFVALAQAFFCVSCFVLAWIAYGIDLLYGNVVESFYGFFYFRFVCFVIDDQAIDAFLVHGGYFFGY